MRDQVLSILDGLDIEYAVIGAVAVAARGAPRSTYDFDLLTTDKRALEENNWTELRNSGVEVDIRRGDADDPLAGVIRFGSKPGQIDMIVGKWKWNSR
jgi:hypothetical protein